MGIRDRVGGAIYGAFQKVNAATQLMNVVPLLNGGTGATSLAGAGIEQVANKNAASGYAGLNSSGVIATTQLGSGTATSGTVLAGNSTWLSLNRANVPEVTTVSASTALTLSVTTSTWVFNGSSPATWTLPPVSGNTGFMMFIENRGSAAITITAAGADHIWFLSSTTTMTVAPGGSLQLSNDGTYWNALSVDLVNNTVGILPVVNGGTGVSSPGVFRQYNNSATVVSPTAGNNLFPNSFFNTNSYLTTGQFTSAPATANKLTVTNAGLYLVTINCIMTPGTSYGSGQWASLAALLYQNGGANPKQGPSVFWHQYTAPTTRANLWFGFTFQVNCAAGDYLQPGYNYQNSTSTLTMAGESTGMQTYWEVANAA